MERTCAMNTTKHLVFAMMACAALAGCDLDKVAPDRPMIDQCLREELFEKCMDKLPAGPTTVNYNDWSKVVGQCRDQAQYTSVRKASLIKPECQTGS